MADVTVKDLIEQRSRLVTEMQALHKLAGDEQRSFTTDEDTKWDKMTNDLKALDRDIQLRNAQDEIDAQQLIEERAEEMAAKLQKKHTPKGDEARSKYNEAFTNFMHFGMGALPVEQRLLLGDTVLDAPEELRALSTTANNSGGMGYAIPITLREGIERFMKWYADIENFARVITTPRGGTYNVTISNTTSQTGQYIAENAQHQQSDPVIDQIAFSDYTLSSDIILASLQSVHDVDGFDLESFIAEEAGTRMGRSKAVQFTTGTGSGQPEGYMNGITSVNANGNTAIIYDDLIALFHSVDPAYRQGPSVRWIFNDATFEIIKMIKDADGRPIFMPGLAESGLAGGAPSTILGKQYSINQAMADVGAGNAKSVAFGDFNKFWIRKVNQQGFMRLTERYADYLQVGFLVFERHDARVVISDAFKALNHV